MNSDIIKYLEDIKVSIGDIEDFISGINTSYQFKSDLKTKNAAERKLAIIGEAINKIKKIDSTIAITNSTKIIGLRHILVHDYDLINSETIWRIIQNDLPILKTETEQILKSLEE